MHLNKFSLKFTLICVLPILFLSSCAAPSKGNVSERIKRDIQIGATKNEVLKFIDSLEINGTKAASSGYAKIDSPQTIPFNGNNVDVEGTVNVELRGRGLFYCGSFAIFYFDKSEKLITYVVDNIYC